MGGSCPACRNNDGDVGSDGEDSETQRNMSNHDELTAEFPLEAKASAEGTEMQDGSDASCSRSAAETSSETGATAASAGELQVRAEKTNPGRKKQNKKPTGSLRTVFFMRHGQTEANRTGKDMLDPFLSDLGRRQAQSWAGRIGRFRPKLALISPLRRAVETACLALAGTTMPIRMCRHARELWWDERYNTLGTPERLQRLLLELPRGSEVQGVADALTPSAEHPANESDSVKHLRKTLMECDAKKVLVVTHQGIIHKLCGVMADNCDLIECDLRRSGRLQILQTHLVYCA
eukprot:TRINITY_DN78514_c0_g1_i1.p1 TRINITY_DN78514_c0_g1~~TRINITY_DN78514_c0_g1_i1.p1  ORF type:complete len:300 (+),score=35.47 TRINITY_DN78514_c0_g1_i1:30-902(+)